MQKSQQGLFQSILYRILKAEPALIPIVCPDRLSHEEWTIEEITTALRNIEHQAAMDVKFGFFIDGLDEYNGTEGDVIEVLRFLSASKHIKLCASTRTRSMFAESFHWTSYTFDVSKYTKKSMEQHVLQRLYQNEKFQPLLARDSRCKEISCEIASLAQGVWL